MSREIATLTDLLTIIHGLEKMNMPYQVRVHTETAEKPRHYIVKLTLPTSTEEVDE